MKNKRNAVSRMVHFLVRIFKRKQPIEKPLVEPHINEAGECISENGVAYKCKYSKHSIGGAWTGCVCPIHQKMGVVHVG